MELELKSLPIHNTNKNIKENQSKICTSINPNISELYIVDRFKWGQEIYNIKYTLDEYRKNKFHLVIDIDEEGYWPETKEYFFDSMSMIRQGIDDDERYYVTAEFATNVPNFPKSTTEYSYNRLSEKDSDLLFKFLTENINKTRRNITQYSDISKKEYQSVYKLIDSYK